MNSHVNVNADRPDLREALAEAQLILSRHEGIHLLHSDCQAIACALSAFDRGRIVDRQSIESILHRMRQTDRSGVYPA